MCVGRAFVQGEFADAWAILLQSLLTPTKKESYDFKISPNIPTVYVLLCTTDEKFHVLL